MLNDLGKFLSPPVFEDEEKTRSAYYISAIALISIPVLVLFFIIRVAQGNALFGIPNLILLSLIVVLTLVWILTKFGAVRLAGYIYISMIWVASTLLALNGSGVRGTGFTSYFVVMLLAGLLLGVRTAVGIAIVSIISGFGLAYAETIGAITYRPGAAFGVAIEATVLFIFSTVFMVLTINSLQNALKKARANANDLEISNRELTELRDVLELRVRERTLALEKRAVQLQAVSSVARTIAALQDLNSLLPEITRLVSEQFGFYHAGIFLIDEANEYAVLQAANSPGGKRMLHRQHRLRLNDNSIVGFATSRGEARIALDVGADAVYFNNPDLPDTRSEMALPLRVGKRVIGALDVQSTETNAFSQEDINILATMADQIAVAIENARLFDEARSALAESQTTFEKYVRQEWGKFGQQARHTGFVFDGKHLLPLDDRERREQIKAAAQTGGLLQEKVSSAITIPIKLRGQTIGALDVRPKNGHRDWTPDEITLLEAASERAALALENARLLESSQQRAARERAIGEISTRIGGASDLEAVLQAAVEELGRKIGAAEVMIELGNEEN